MADLHEQIALFVASYRRSGGDPSATQAATLAAFPGAQPADYAAGLIAANRAERTAPSDPGEARHG